MVESFAAVVVVWNKTIQLKWVIKKGAKLNSGKEEALQSSCTIVRVGFN
jgi:hypothetical protein